MLLNTYYKECKVLDVLYDYCNRFTILIHVYKYVNYRNDSFIYIDASFYIKLASHPDLPHAVFLSEFGQTWTKVLLVQINIFK